ncbi:MAG TPA: NADH-quinone oxidoreductase subunit J [Longimicrobiales bacterium]
MTELLFYLFASLAIGGAFGTVASKRPITSLLSLVLSFFSLAAVYVLLGAHFIAAIQVIVYAGAIMVLFLFVIMLLNLGHDYRADLRRGAWIIVGFGAAGLTGYLVSRVLASDAAQMVPAAAAEVDRAVRELNAVGAIADPLFREFLVPFELTSILLLVAVIGAVLLAKRRV